MIMAEAFDRWLVAHAAEVRPISLKAYEITVRVHLIPDIGNEDVEEFDSQAVGRWFPIWREKKSKAVLFQMKKTLVAMLNWLVSENVILKNPVKKVYIDKTPPDIKILSTGQVKVFLSALKNSRSSLFPCFSVLATGGLRASELRGLKIENVNLADGTISVVKTYYGGEEHETKTKAARRTLDMPSFVMTAIEKHIRKIQRKHTESPWLFQNREGLPVSNQHLGQAFHRWQRKLELPRVTLHSLRHAHATFLLEEGRSLKAIQQRLGWSSAAMLMMRYAHVTKEERRRVVESIETFDPEK
jgi:integrase